MKASKRDLVGRKIVAVDLDVMSPALTLDNGRRVFFVVQETDGADYGVRICITE